MQQGPSLLPADEAAGKESSRPQHPDRASRPQHPDLASLMISATPSIDLRKEFPVPGIKESESGSSIGSVKYEDWMTLEDLLDSIQDNQAWTYDLEDETLSKIAEHPEMMSPQLVETLMKSSRCSCDRARVAARIMFATGYAKVVVFWPATSQRLPSPSESAVTQSAVTHHELNGNGAVAPETLLTYLAKTSRLNTSEDLAECGELYPDIISSDYDDNNGDLLAFEVWRYCPKPGVRLDYKLSTMTTMLAEGSQCPVVVSAVGSVASAGKTESASSGPSRTGGKTVNETKSAADVGLQVQVDAISQHPAVLEKDIYVQSKMRVTFAPGAQWSSEGGKDRGIIFKQTLEYKRPDASDREIDIQGELQVSAQQGILDTDSGYEIVSIAIGSRVRPSDNCFKLNLYESRINNEVQSSTGASSSTSDTFGGSFGVGCRVGDGVAVNIGPLMGSYSRQKLGGTSKTTQQKAAAGYTFEERLRYDRTLVYSVQSSADYEKASQARHFRWRWGITRCRSSLPLSWSAEAQVHLLRRCPKVYNFMLYNVVKLENIFDVAQPGYSNADLTYKLEQSGKLTADKSQTRGTGRIVVINRWKHLNDTDDQFVVTDDTLAYASWLVTDDITVELVGQAAAGLLFNRFKPDPDGVPVIRYE